MGNRDNPFPFVSSDRIRVTGESNHHDIIVIIILIIILIIIIIIIIIIIFIIIIIIIIIILSVAEPSQPRSSDSLSLAALVLPSRALKRNNYVYALEREKRKRRGVRRARPGRADLINAQRRSRKEKLVFIPVYLYKIPQVRSCPEFNGEKRKRESEFHRSLPFSPLKYCNIFKIL